MKIIEKVLKNKLSQYGYNVDTISEKLKQIDFDLIDNQIAFENEAENFITIKEYNEPTVEIARMLANYNKYYIQNMIIEGEINYTTAMSSINTVMPVVDYKLSNSICIVATTTALNVEVIIYSPDARVAQMYGNQTYENAFSDERNKIAKEYYDAFVENGRVPEIKVKGILALLLSEYVIDELTITGANPKIKMYDNVDAYAENITEYKIKYINRKTNKVELAHKPIYIKRLGTGVSAGFISNDPYIKLDNLPEGADFPLNVISYYWTNATRNKKEEISIYIATKPYGNYKTYKEYRENSSNKYGELINALVLQFQKETGFSIDREYISNVLKKLNPELIYPSMDIIRDCMDNPADPVEPIRYKYKAISVPEDFESRLYISIEDNLGKRYKYKLTENVLDDLTRVGNKLEYTGEDGNIVRKQSVADFNVNACTAIIRRETLIDSTQIPGLLGYIYEDVEYIGTDMLPVPSIEVDFYFPLLAKSEISMFNGTNFESDMASFENANKFNATDGNTVIDTIPGTTYAVVRYVNSKGEVLKENKITNLFPGTPYVPEIIPIINDINGLEWVCSNSQYPSTVINMIPEYNVIEIKYVEKFSKVTIVYLNREGKKICDDVIETLQAGTTYDLSKKMQYTDEQNNDWRLVTARPQKLLVKDDESKNNIILIYDLEKEPVKVRFLKPDGEEVKEALVKDFQVGKQYTLQVDRIIIDKEGLGWVYNGKNPVSCMVEEDKENLIEVTYEEYKLPVVVKYQTEDGVVILNDYVEYLQVGKEFIPKYENDVTDFKLKRWKFKSLNKKELIVSKNKDENEIKVIYEPLLANVFIQLFDEMGKKIISPIQKEAQIGGEFSSGFLDDITDNYGKMWTKADEPKTLIVSDIEAENNITIKYKPLIVKVVVKFFDDERNELIPSKNYERQAGTKFIPEIIKKLESSDGRKWIYNDEKNSEVTVRKNEEENIVSIFYDKELTDVRLEFMDAYNNVIRDSTVVQAQIGSVFNERLFEKVEDREGCKWMLESSEPKKMVVKVDNNNFKLFYGEMKAIVIVKHINVNTNKSIIDDIVAKVKLGGVFVPNIPEKIFDSNKLQWSFIGDKNFSIVVKENEQENIVMLQYDETLAKVNVKYQDTYNNKLRDDIDYDYQIGKDVDLKNMEKFIDNNGIGWKLQSSKTKNNKVQESGNEVVNTYEPWYSEVKVRYLNDKDEEIADPFVKKIQVGRGFKPTYENRIEDGIGLLWTYSSISEEEIKLSENGNTIDVKYEPVYSNVTERLFNKAEEKIGDEIVNKYQVGSNIKFTPEEIYVDSETKKWNFIKVDRPSIRVKESEEQNIVNRVYEPRMTDLIVKMLDDNSNEIADQKKYSVQVGSIYKANVPKTHIDKKTGLGWALPENPEDTMKVDEDKSKNILSVKYIKYMVKVTDRIVDLDKNIIIPDTEKMLQVGTTYAPHIEQVLNDQEGKEWLYNEKRKKDLLFDSAEQAKAFKGEKLEITVSEDEEKNIVFLKYKPSLEKVTIKYQNDLGEIIAPEEEVDAQIGSVFTPNIKEMVVDSKKNKWAYNPNSKSTITVSRDKTKNLIVLSYEEEKAPIIYLYCDEYDNELREPKKKLAQIGSICTPEIDSIVSDNEGKVWEYKSANVDKITVKDSEKDNIVKVTYVPLLMDVKVYFKSRKGELIGSETQKAQLGSTFKPATNETINDKDSKMYRIIGCEPEELVIKENPIGVEEEINKFNVSYDPVFSDITTVYQDVDGNKLKDDEVIQLQVGTKYTPKLIQFVKDRKGIQWQNISETVDAIRVMEDPKSNIIKMTFELAKAEVLVRYKDIDGNIIRESERFDSKIGEEFVPKIEDIIEDAKSRKWVFSMADPVKLTVGSINNIINLIYQEKKVPVVIKYETIDGKKLKEDTKVNVQEGSQYTPKKNYPIIYDENNEMWRYLEFRPSSLLVTDKDSENIIIQVYDNKEESERKPVLENPFANTLTEEEMKIVEEQTAKIEMQKKEEEMAKERAAANNTEEEIFKDKNLIDLSRSVVLENNEKQAIVKLNELNKKIIGELNTMKTSFDLNMKDSVLRNISQYMQEEKDIIEKELSDMITNDKSGKKFMKVLEAIVQDDFEYSKMQQRKNVLLTDYFVNSKISANEQANYICERGKNEKGLLVLQEKIKNEKKNIAELQKLFIEMIYERAMLDNYYKTRTKAKDDYFINEADRNSMGSEIVILVTNILPRQAYSILQKDTNISLAQENELDAIINLLTPQQRTTLEKMVDDTKDNRLKKSMQKRLKNIT